MMGVRGGRGERTAPLFYGVASRANFAAFAN